MTTRFVYPRSYALLAGLLQAMGHGPKSWPRRPGISAKTVGRIADDQPAAQSLDEFLDAALGLLGSPSGRWQFDVLPRDAALARLRDGLAAYDRTVSQLNADMSRVANDPRHALPILVALAVRVGVWIGVLAAQWSEPVDELWARSPFDSLAFGRAIDHYAAQALPGAPQRERRLACGFGKNTVDRWQKHGPGRLAKLAGLPRFARWVADHCKGVDAGKIEWHLRWLAAGSRLREKLDDYLGRDGAGRPWVDRLWQTARLHADLNHAVHRDDALFGHVTALMDEAAADSSEALALRRLFAWIVGRTRMLGEDGVALTIEELTAVRTHLDDEQARRHLWARFGLLHALGFPSAGHLSGLARVLPPEFLAQYTFHQHQAHEYLHLQHLQVAATLRLPDPDDVLAQWLRMPFNGTESRRYADRRDALLRDPPVNTPELPGMFLAYDHFAAHQQRLAGLAVPSPARLADERVPVLVREMIALIELQRTLPELQAAGGDEAVQAELERVIAAHPTMVEPALMLLSGKLETFLKVELKIHTLEVTLRQRLASEYPSPSTYTILRGLLKQRRSVKEIRKDFEGHCETLHTMITTLAGQLDDRWHIDFILAVFQARRALLAAAAARLLRRERSRHLADRLAALATLHATRPDHPAPCQWLARLHEAAGDRRQARHWARLAAHRGAAAH